MITDKIDDIIQGVTPPQPVTPAIVSLEPNFIPDNIVYTIEPFSQDIFTKVTLLSRSIFMDQRVAVFIATLKSADPKHAASQKGILRNFLCAQTSDTSALQKELRSFLATDDSLNSLLQRDEISIPMIIMTLFAHLEIISKQELSTVKNKYNLILKILADYPKNDLKILEGIYFFLDDLDKDKVINELLASLSSDEYSVRADAILVIKCIFPDVNDPTKNKIIEHIILKLNSFDKSTHLGIIKTYWGVLKAIFPVVNDKESVIKYILSSLKSTNQWIRNGALEAIPIIFPYASESNKETILNLFLVWVDLHGGIDINIMQVTASIILKVEDKKIYIEKLVNKIKQIHFNEEICKVLMTLFIYAESQKPKILVLVITALQNISAKKFDRFEDLEHMFRNIHQKGQNVIVDLLICHLAFNAYSAANEDYIPLDPNKESQVLKNIFPKIKDKNDAIISIETLISQNDNVPSDFENEPNIWARWPDLLTIYPYMDNKSKLIDAALLQLQSNHQVFVVSACESLPGMYKDALNKNSIVNALLTVLSHREIKLRTKVAQALVKILPKAGIHDKIKIRNKLKSIVTDEQNVVRWEECPELLQVFLHSDPPDTDKVQMFHAALLQLRSLDLDTQKMGSKALEIMFLQEDYKLIIINNVLGILVNPPRHQKLDEPIFHLIQIIFPQLLGPNKILFVNALIQRLEDDDVDRFRNVLWTLKNIFGHLEPASQQAIIEALHPQLKSDEVVYFEIGKAYLNILAQTKNISQEFAELDTKFLRSSKLAAELLPKVFPQLQGEQSTLNYTYVS